MTKLDPQLDGAWEGACHLSCFLSCGEVPLLFALKLP